MVLAKRAKNPPTLAQPQRAYDAATFITAEAPSVLRTELGQALGRGRPWQSRRQTQACGGAADPLLACFRRPETAATYAIPTALKAADAPQPSACCQVSNLDQ
jgi:hypothetical protein